MLASSPSSGYCCREDGVEPRFKLPAAESATHGQAVGRIAIISLSIQILAPLTAATRRKGVLDELSQSVESGIERSTLWSTAEPGGFQAWRREFKACRLDRD